MKNEGKIKDYILNSFGWDVKFENPDSLRGKLPYALWEAAEYSFISCSGYRGVAIEPRANCDFRQMQYLVKTVEYKTGAPALLVLDSIDAYQRRVLIEKYINFIIPYKQIFIPNIGILLNERGLGVRRCTPDMLSAVAVSIIVNQLTNGKLQDKSVSQVASMMGYSVKTLSLAVNELKAQGLLELKQEGRKKLLNFTLTNQELWDRTYNLAENPVDKQMFTTNTELAAEIGIKASDYALSEVSMLSMPQREVYAVYSRNPRLKELNPNTNDGSAIIEIWKTDPTLTAENGNIDIFSLALSYKNEDEPRIRKEIKKLLVEKL